MPAPRPSAKMIPGRRAAPPTGTGGTMAKRKPRNEHLVEPTWGRSEDGGPPLTELTSEAAGPLSPFGEDHSFPLPPERIRYAHPTSKPNRAGKMAGEPPRR
ncbi:hypothetical protein OF117_09780 [Geodermatophilus sp. YIM 151500]|uniref:hypothetical protein n=1 Tax=Geodermatophilus sp. YIM 151500 TaxID=2984531 RepID=UPI0021E44005|nr:hypothetical protein [Geodermatophilus sp. YIM 151500]MCV2489654.1 hypothetical protein [Geodermatophilus sp. YIM 151500]